MPMLTVFFSYILVNSLIAFWGRNKKMGFWGYFFASMCLTPFIGALLVIVTEKRREDD